MARTKAAAKATEDYVRANPWKTMGIAAAAGFVLCICVRANPWKTVGIAATAGLVLGILERR